jgi:catechol 2,3-dioxygenase-like lactoylglutathione lyase family enzyme
MLGWESRPGAERNPRNVNAKNLQSPRQVTGFGRDRGKGKRMTMATQTKPRLTSLAPQFLVDELKRSMAYYQRLGFRFGEPWGGFYAIGSLDGFELHLKEAPKNLAERQHRRENDHLDAAAGVDGIETFYEQCVANGVKIRKPLEVTPWGTKGFYIEDPDGYIVAFGGAPAD